MDGGGMFWKIKRFIKGLRDSFEYYFAKKWLNRTFGEQEYWGEFILELINNEKEESNK